MREEPLRTLERAYPLKLEEEKREQRTYDCASVVGRGVKSESAPPCRRRR